MRSTHVWQPLSISGKTVSMNDYDYFLVDVSCGTRADGPDETAYEGDNATLTDSAKVQSCSNCSGG
jgi:hypothetical protein